MKIRVNLFGSVRLSHSDRGPVAFPTARSRSLFCFLVLNRRRMYPRDVLAGVFWGDVPDAVARKNLRNDIWRIRGLLEPDPEARGTILLTEGDAVGISGSEALWVDVEEFERRLDRASGCPGDRLTEAAEDALRGAIALYRGDLMEDVYEDWCLVEQQRLKVRLLDAIERLMRCHEACGEWGMALVYGQKILHSDPLREHIQRDVMRYYYFQGNRPAALRQFDAFARLLEQEMGIAPMRQTIQLREAICKEALQCGSTDRLSLPNGGTPASAGGHDEASLGGEIRSALRELEVAAARLRASISRVPGVGPSQVSR